LTASAAIAMIAQPARSIPRRPEGILIYLIPSRSFPARKFERPKGLP
jgi:hypothetical protein